MDLVLKFHPETERLLIKAQKHFLRQINEENGDSIAFPFYPMYARLTGLNVKTPEEAKSSIAGITLSAIKTSKSGSGMQIVCPVTVTLNDGSTFEGSVLLGTLNEATEKNYVQDFFEKPKSFMICKMRQEGFVTEFYEKRWLCDRR